MPDPDYEAAAAYWDPKASTSTYLRPIAVKFIESGVTAPVEPQAHGRVQDAISRKINQFRPVRKKA